MRRATVTMVLFIGISLVAGRGFLSLPTGFLPEEDMGYLVGGIQLPDAASQQRTREAAEKIEAILQDTPGIADWVTIGGLSLLDNTNTSNAAAFYIVMEPFEERTSAETAQNTILASLRGLCAACSTTKGSAVSWCKRAYIRQHAFPGKSVQRRRYKSWRLWGECLRKHDTATG